MRNETDKLSVFISLILRHKPEAAGIVLDEHGWANVDELLAGINNTGRSIDMGILERIVQTDQKGRYSFNEDKTLIRANQGHSISVDVELEEQKPPETLYHGTAARLGGGDTNGKNNKILWDENRKMKFDFSSALDVFEPHELANLYS